MRAIVLLPLLLVSTTAQKGRTRRDRIDQAAQLDQAIGGKVDHGIRDTSSVYCLTKEVWTAEKTKFCCDNYDLGCPTGEQYNCMTLEIWTDEKKQWCCDNQQLGCSDDMGEAAGFIAISEGRENYEESFRWESFEDAKTLTVQVPPHGTFEHHSRFFFFSDPSGNFHNVRHNYMYQAGSNCYVSSVPTSTSPEMIASGLKRLSRENGGVLSGEATISYNAIIVSSTRVEVSTLHPNIRKLCKDSDIHEFTQERITADQHKSLIAGQRIVVKEERATATTDCTIVSNLIYSTTSSCFHWTNPVTGSEISVHEYFDVVSPIFCCSTPPGGDPLCCDDPSMTGQYPDVQPPVGGPWNDPSATPSISPHHQVYMCRCEDPDLQAGGNPCRCINDIVVGTDGPHCNDGILNQDEVNIDCGGSCPTCGVYLSQVSRPTTCHPPGVRRNIQVMYDEYLTGSLTANVSLMKPMEDVWRAFIGIQGLPVNNVNSYFRIAGYHGLSGLLHAGTSVGGWCAHGNLRFFGWHRAYLLRIEQALQSVVPGVMLPFWDETCMDSMDGANLPAVFTISTVTLDGVSHPNPLRSYQLQQAVGGCPAGTVTWRAVNSFWISSIRNNYQNAMTETTFADGSDGVEDPHGSVHANLIQGWMGSVSTAAFDPIFFIHHSFVDYAYWVWQQEHPSVPVPAWDSDTPLVPFIWSDDGREVTNEEMHVEIDTLGYTYENSCLGDWVSALPPAPPPTGLVQIRNLETSLLDGTFSVFMYAEDQKGQQYNVGISTKFRKDNGCGGKPCSKFENINFPVRPGLDLSASMSYMFEIEHASLRTLRNFDIQLVVNKTPVNFFSGIVKCADEGEMCSCENGQVFFGQRHNDMNTQLTFREMKQASYRSKSVFGSITCSSKAFGVDPLRGQEKQCYCKQAFAGWPCEEGGGGKCKECLPPTLRTAAEQCLDCNDGYYLDDVSCKPYWCLEGAGSSCKSCLPQALRTANGQCMLCNSGYNLHSTSCVACTDGRSNCPGWRSYCSWHSWVQATCKFTCDRC